METQAHHTEEIYKLAEDFYRKGHFLQAGPLFEQVAAQHPDDGKAHIAAALCYLEMARDIAAQASKMLPNHLVFQSDLERIHNSRQKLQSIPWRGSRDGAQYEEER